MEGGELGDDMLRLEKAGLGMIGLGMTDLGSTGFVMAE